MRFVSISRRRLLLVPFLAAIGARLRDVNAALIDGTGRKYDPLDSLPSYLDTLIPDYLGLSATELGVGGHLLDMASTNEQYRALLIAGCRWLDHRAVQEYSGRFSLLPESARISIIETAESAASDTLERVFFERTRRDAFRYYYAQPESWRYLNFPGPPQPNGYPDFYQAVTRSENERG